MGILIAKIDLKKTNKTKKKFVIKNASMCARIKIESIFRFFILKKDRRILSLVIRINDTKMANMLIEKKLALDYTLYKCIRYNSI